MNDYVTVKSSSISRFAKGDPPSVSFQRRSQKNLNLILPRFALDYSSMTERVTQHAATYAGRESGGIKRFNDLLESVLDILGLNHLAK